MWEPNRKTSSLPRLALILFGVCVIFIGGILFAADLKCSYDIENWWAVPYPGAETVRIEHDDWYRPRALFQTVQVMRSPDDVETVKQWYREKTLFVLREGRTRGLAYSDYKVQEADDGGSMIVLYSSCGM